MRKNDEKIDFSSPPRRRDFRAENRDARGRRKKTQGRYLSAAIRGKKKDRSRPVYEVSGGGEFNGKTDRGLERRGRGEEGERRRWEGGGSSGAEAGV